MRAVVAGGSGLVGGHLLAELSALGVAATAFARRPGPIRPGIEWRVTDLSRLDAADMPAGTDRAFCALGTTIKVAGSQEAFRAVDEGMVLNFARAARRAGIQQFHAVSAMGADPASRIFYSRVKGEVEAALRDLAFPTLVLYRPSMLAGERPVPRPGEGLGLAAARFLRPVLPARYRAIQASTVARAMVRQSVAAPAGVHVLDSAAIARLGT